MFKIFLLAVGVGCLREKRSNNNSSIRNALETAVAIVMIIVLVVAVVNVVVVVEKILFVCVAVTNKLLL